MHSNTVYRIIFYGIKWQRRTHFRAQSCGFWVFFGSYCLIVTVLNRVTKKINCAQSGSSRYQSPGIYIYVYVAEVGIQVGMFVADSYRTITGRRSYPSSPERVPQVDVVVT
jgi:hypothetical protein